MAAVIKLKRHLSSDPIEALVINCKRRKIDDIDEKSESCSTVFTLAGTINKQDDLRDHISKIKKTNLEQKYTKHNTSNIKEKIRKQTKDASQKNHLKVINCFRAIEIEHDEVFDEDDKRYEANYTVVEVEDETEKRDSDFVYDLYYTNSKINIDNLISIEPIEDELVFGAENNGSDYNAESDDSNDENNWRNDYPDSDIDENDMLNAIQGMTLDEDNELSSDDGEEGLVYNYDSEYNNKLNRSDVMRYGKMYTQFKTRCLEDEDCDDEYGVDRDLQFGESESEENTSDLDFSR